MNRNNLANNQSNDNLVDQKIAKTQPIVDQPNWEESGLGLNDTEYIAEQVGLEVPDKVPLNVKETFEKRDAERAELDPDSSKS